jgi:hypothetical protein
MCPRILSFLVVVVEIQMSEVFSSSEKKSCCTIKNAWTFVGQCNALLRLAESWARILEGLPAKMWAFTPHAAFPRMLPSPACRLPPHAAFPRMLPSPACRLHPHAVFTPACRLLPHAVFTRMSPACRLLPHAAFTRMSSPPRMSPSKVAQSRM